MKSALVVGGRPIGARVLAAVADAGRRVVVGEPVPAEPAAGASGGVGSGRRGAVDVVTREEPAGGGPVAALAAGMRHVTAPVVAVLGGDLPFVTPAVVRALRDGLGDGAVALLVDDSGRDQFLCAVWSAAALRRALAAVGGPAGVPLRAVLAAADGPVRRVRAPADGPPAWFDCDTEQDLATARAWAGG